MVSWCTFIDQAEFHDKIVANLLHQYDTVYVHGFSQHMLIVVTFWVPGGSGTWLG